MKRLVYTRVCLRVYMHTILHFYRRCTATLEYGAGILSGYLILSIFNVFFSFIFHYMELNRFLFLSKCCCAHLAFLLTAYTLQMIDVSLLQGYISFIKFNYHAVNVVLMSDVIFACLSHIFHESVTIYEA